MTRYPARDAWTLDLRRDAAGRAARQAWTALVCGLGVLVIGLTAIALRFEAIVQAGQAGGPV